MAWGVWIDDTRLDSLGLYVEDLSTRWHAPSRQFPTLAVPGLAGSVLTAEPTTGPRQLTITASLDPAARTLPALQSAIDALQELTGHGLVRITVDDDENAPRVIEGVCTECQIAPVVHPLVTQVARVTLTLVCPRPTWEDVAPQVVALGSTPTPIPIGTAESGGVIWIAAPAWSANVVTPVVTLRAASGRQLATLTWAGTLTAGTDALALDLDRSTAIKYASGTASNAIASLSGDFFPLTPPQGAPRFASYPTLQVTASSGTPSATWVGPRRWR